MAKTLTINCQKRNNFTLKRQKRNNFTVNRQMSQPILAVKCLRHLKLELDTSSGNKTVINNV